jgi:hypothetical protein
MANVYFLPSIQYFNVFLPIVADMQGWLEKLEGGSTVSYLFKGLLNKLIKSNRPLVSPKVMVWIFDQENEMRGRGAAVYGIIMWWLLSTPLQKYSSNLDLMTDYTEYKTVYKTWVRSQRSWLFWWSQLYWRRKWQWCCLKEEMYIAVKGHY